MRSAASQSPIPGAGLITLLRMAGSRVCVTFLPWCPETNCVTSVSPPEIMAVEQIPWVTVRLITLKKGLVSL